MIRTTRIKRSLAPGTSIAAGQILSDGQLSPAPAAQDGRHVALCFGPARRTVASESFMTAYAGIELAAALVADGNDVAVGVPVCALRIWLDVNAMDSWR